MSNQMSNHLKNRSVLAVLMMTTAACVLVFPIGDRCPTAQAHEDHDKVQPKRPDGFIAYQVDQNWPLRPGIPGVAVDKKDQVWVFTRGRPSVQVYDKNGGFVRAWGGDGVIGRAHHIEIDPSGNIWLTDMRLHTVMQFTPEGTLIKTLGTSGEPGCDETHFDRPTDVAITSDGEVFVSDGYGNSRIVHFDRDGKFVKAWGKFGSGPGEFDMPHAIAVDSKGTLYVGDRNNGRVQVFDQDGQFLDEWSNIVVPWGIWITPADDIWVCGSLPAAHHDEGGGLGIPPKDQMFMRFAPSGKLMEQWGVPVGIKGKEKPGELNWVHGIAVDSKGNIYASDIGGRVQKFVRKIVQKPVLKDKKK